MYKNISNKKNFFVVCLIITFSIISITFWGNQKKGFYVDEYYTFTDANGVGEGIAVKNNSWNNTDSYIYQLSNDNSDSLAQLYNNTANNVHPLGYYLIIHFISSLVPGVFSKWIGIISNILIFIPCCLIFYNLAYKLTDKSKYLSIIALIAFAFSPAIISGVLLIRMYLLFSFFTTMNAYIIINNIAKKSTALSLYIPAFIIAFCGFLTHYYFVIFLFFSTFFYCVFLLFIQKDIQKCIKYGLCNLFGLIATYFVWPTSVYHIFKGYRGTGAMKSLVNTSGTAISHRFSLFIDLINKGLFGGFLIIAFIILIIAITIIIRDKSSIKDSISLAKECNEKATSIWGTIILFLTCFCYFIIVTKIGLTAKEASNRYQYPSYGIILIVFINILYFVLIKLFSKERFAYAYIGTIFVLLTMISSSYLQNQVLYLYPEEEQIAQWEAEHSDIDVLVCHLDEGMYDSRIQDWMRFKKIFFISEKDIDIVNDSKILNADELLVYVEKKGNVERDLSTILNLNDNLSSIELLFETNGPFDIYILK